VGAGTVPAVAGDLLVLWDVDHTLVDAAGLGRRALETAFAQVFGAQPAYVPELSGRTDRAIVLDALAGNGTVDGHRRLDDFRDASVTAFEALLPALATDGRVLPGVTAALAACLEKGYTQSLLTGNIRAIAEMKMRVFDLAGYLDLEIGGYGWSTAVRAELVGEARAAARERLGRDVDPSSIVLVGDTPRDVEAARAAGVAVVAVATGYFDEARLRAAGASVVLPDLSDTGRLLAALASATVPGSELSN
jgi:phosphoglycolate phosphatase